MAHRFAWPAAQVSPSPQNSMTTWVTRIHPRFLPRNGIGKRSMRGAQRNLKLHGAWVRAKRPITLMSAWMYFIHAGTAIQTSPSGRLDENMSRAMERSLQLWTTARKLSQVESFWGGVV